MKVGDFVYCKKDFFRDFENEDPLLRYPKHAFYLGKKYRVFFVDAGINYLEYLIEIDEVYYESFLREEDYNKRQELYAVLPESKSADKIRIYNFDEYFFDNIRDFRKFKLNYIKTKQ